MLTGRYLRSKAVANTSRLLHGEEVRLRNVEVLEADYVQPCDRPWE
jgi:hypothetical protein